MSVASSEKTREKKGSGFGETVKIVIQALLLALIVRTFLFQPFNIPSGSMKATLLVGDYLFVSKYSYGYSKYSLPFSPPLPSGRLPSGWLPERGDVVVFRPAPEPDRDFIKRVIGVPGDTLEIRNKVVLINGKPLHEDYTRFVDGAAVDAPTIRVAAEAVDGVRSAYAIRSRTAAALTFAEVTIAVDGGQNVAAAHHIADAVEDKLRDELGFNHVQVHVEPC